MSVKISELTAAGVLTGTEEVPLVQSSATKKVTVNDLLPVQLQENKEIDLGAFELAFQSGQGSDPAMEVAQSLNEWYASFINGADQCTIHVDASGATLDKGSGTKQIATETGVSGTFTTVDLKTVTVVNGIITVITD